MPSRDPHCTACMETRAFDGITYSRDPQDPDIWQVIYEGRETDTAVSPNLVGGEVGWWAIEFRESDGVHAVVAVYGYAHLIDFEQAYAARAGRERVGRSGDAPPPDNEGASPTM